MDLNTALRVLADFHTRDDDVTGFVVSRTRMEQFLTPWTERDYIQAWKVVREHLHMQTEPKR